MRVLLVEDLASDELLTLEALRDAGLSDDVVVVHDGEAALGELRGPDRPDLVLLDLNLPRKSGREVLDEVRSDPELRLVPIIVLTTSTSPSDIALAYRHQANAYVRKPNGYVALTAAATAIRDFWVRTATLPSAGIVGPGSQAT